jgi:hypothetical protein
MTKRMTPWEKMVASYLKPLPKVEKPKLPPDQKLCNGCGEVKSRDDFYRRSSHSPNAVSAQCRECLTRKNNSRVSEVRRHRREGNV